MGVKLDNGTEVAMVSLNTCGPCTYFGFAPFDVHVPGDEPVDGISAGDTQNPCEAPTETHGEHRRGGKSGIFALCVLRVRRRERDTRAKEHLDEMTPRKS
jgi:hypothetical protein